MAKLATPYLVTQPHELVGKLLLGNWLVYQHEWAGPDGDPQYWRETLAARCEAADVPVEFVINRRMALTVAYNLRTPPLAEQVEDSLRAVAYYRRLGRKFPSELEA